MRAAIVLYFLFLGVYQSDVYYITFLRGSVHVESSGKTLKIGDKVTAKDKLIFKDKNSKVSCISPSKGRFDITPDSSPPNARGEWLAVLSSKLVPSSSYQHLSTRSLSVDKGHDPKAFFENQADKPVVLLNGIALPVRQSYTIDANNFFFVQFEHEGRTIVRKVPNSEQSLVFNRELFSDNEGKLISASFLSKVMLCYQTRVSSVPRSTMLVTFQPLLLERNELQNEINILYEHLKPLKKYNDKEIYEEILAHLNDNYGKVNAVEIERQFFSSLK